MDDTKLKALMQHVADTLSLPYFPHEEVRTFVTAMDNFLSRAGNSAWLTAIAACTDEKEYIKEYLKENGLVVPTDATNALNLELDVAGQELTTMHRYIQSKFFQLILVYIKYQAALFEAGYYDKRNEWATKNCKKIYDFLVQEDILP